MTTNEALRVAGRVVMASDSWLLYLVVIKCFLVLRWSNPSGSSGDWISYLIIFSACVWLAFRYYMELTKWSS